MADEHDARRAERRQYWLAGLVLGVGLVGATVLSIVTAGNGGVRRDSASQLQEQGGAKPHIIPLPNSGHAPTGPGDRGGWQQFLTLGLIVAGVGLLALLAWRGSRRARVGRSAWLAAGRAPDAVGPAPARGVAPAPGRGPPSAPLG